MLLASSILDSQPVDATGGDGELRPAPQQDPALQPDRITLSPDAQRALGGGQGSASPDGDAPPLIGSPEPGQTSERGRAAKKVEPGSRGARPVRSGPKRSGELTEQQRRVVAKLAARDREVRAHEAAHQAAGGSMVGGASYDYETGPDGRSYAVGGRVPIQLSPGRTPQETIARAEQARAAALAPADPSAADLAVAAQAAEMEREARAQQVLQQRDALDSAVHSVRPGASSALLTAVRGLAAYHAGES